MQTSRQARTESDTRQRIIDACLSCIDRWGLEKTSINDIANEAGVTRPTVYSYFPNKDEIINATLLLVGSQFGEKLQKHYSRFDSPRERLLEAVVFAWKQLPKEPYLGSALATEQMAQYINERAISSSESEAIRRVLFEDILLGEARFMKELDEISEVTTRFLLSLLLVEGPKKRNEKELRTFLQRRLLPAVGMD